MMGLPQSEIPPMYPQPIQLKLYQAFIFSIPILFSIILFLLFYLFYLKRRASALIARSPVLPTSSNQASTYIHSTCQHIGWKGEIKDKLPTIIFDEELRARESQCCVCLGEFEIKEELLQVPSCKHVFHVECIHLWLHSNTTCPLCRCSITPVTKLCNPVPPASSTVPQDGGTNSELNPQEEHQWQHHQQQLDGGAGNSNVPNLCRQQLCLTVEGSSSASSTCLSSSGRSSEFSNCTGDDDSFDQEPVVLHIQSHDT